MQKVFKLNWIIKEDFTLFCHMSIHVYKRHNTDKLFYTEDFKYTIMLPYSTLILF